MRKLVRALVIIALLLLVDYQPALVPAPGSMAEPVMESILGTLEGPALESAAVPSCQAAPAEAAYLPCGHQWNSNVGAACTDPTLGMVDSASKCESLLGPSPVPGYKCIYCCGGCSGGCGGSGGGGHDPIGYLDYAGCDRISGWAGDQDANNTPIWVHLYADGPAGSGTSIGSVLADSLREAAVGAHFGGNRNHGFHFYDIPDWLRTGTNRSIYAYGINAPGTGGSNKHLTNSPRTINCPPPNPKACSFSDVQDDILDGVNDSWCTSNDDEGLRFAHTGVQTVNGQYNPGFWNGTASCSSGTQSFLWGEKYIYIDDIDEYSHIEARTRVDDWARVYINEVATVSGSNCTGHDGCAGCGSSWCTGAWVYYSVTLPQSGYHIMNAHLKHDYGCDYDQLAYRFKFDGQEATTYPAIKGDDSWEWAIIDLGYRSAGTYSFGFALNRDCWGGSSATDLNAYVDQFTFSVDTGGLRAWCCNSWTGWTNVKSQLRTGWNIVRFLAEDHCSSRMFDMDWRTTLAAPSSPPSMGCSSYRYGTSWSRGSVTGATDYDVEIWGPEGYKLNGYVGGVSSWSYASSYYGSTYYGRARACNASGCSGWSGTASCVVPNPTPTATPTRTPTPSPTPIPVVFTVSRDYDQVIYYGANLTPPQPVQTIRGNYVGPLPRGGRTVSIEVYDAAGHTNWWNVTTTGNGDFILGPAETGDVNFGATEIGTWSATAYITVNSVVYQAGPVYWEVKWFTPHETG
jgi:hypothetical protein